MSREKRFSIKNYVSTEERCRKSERDFQEGHLKIEAYDPLPPYKNKGFFRDYDPGRQIGPDLR